MLKIRNETFIQIIIFSMLRVGGKTQKQLILYTTASSQFHGIITNRFNFVFKFDYYKILLNDQVVTDLIFQRDSEFNINFICHKKNYLILAPRFKNTQNRIFMWSHLHERMRYKCKLGTFCSRLLSFIV